MGKFSRLGNDLYNGKKSIDFVERRAPWYAFSGVLMALCLGVILIKGLAFGIEFTGGTQFRIENLPSISSSQTRADDLRQAVVDLEITDGGLPTVTTAGPSSLVLELESVSTEDSARISELIVSTLGADIGDISESDIGASWGQEVAERAILGVFVFLLLVVIFIWVYFRQWKMSVAALVALIHDIVITIGIYALSGFPVTPAAVTGLLAILGFSMYDTVVVFDKVRENTTAKELQRTRLSYAGAANLAVNQTLVRSINTSIVALIPIGAILVVSSIQLGESSLLDLALAQFVGMAAGVYSSVFIAPRVLVHLKSGEAKVKEADRRAKARARHDADRYANVPAFTDDLALSDGGEDPDELAEDAPVRSSFVAPAAKPTAAGSGRVVPDAKAPVEQSGAANRPQPTRQPRSKRGK